MVGSQHQGLLLYNCNNPQSVNYDADPQKFLQKHSYLLQLFTLINLTVIYN